MKDTIAEKNAADMILTSARLLMRGGGPHEMRILKAGKWKTVSGYYDSPQALSRDAIRWNGKAPAIYVTLNPCVPAVLSRAANRCNPHAEITTGDHEIAWRNWLLVDCDPVRPSGISSTDEEHGRAISTACAIWDDLRGDFGDPVVADSGNGAHLLYPISLPNIPESTDIVKRVLMTVAERCAPSDIAVDLTVFNAARITKLYGTLTRKGDNTPDRPHRRSRLLEVPDPILRRAEAA